jgi:hypothetical protein
VFLRTPAGDLNYKNPSFLAQWAFGPAWPRYIPCYACVANAGVRHELLPRSEEQI